MLVTQSTAAFIDDAAVLDIGIIGLDALERIDPSPSVAANETARIISAAVADHSLTAERGGYILLLTSRGEHVFKRLA
jgi:hypothetical protein